MAPSTTVCRGLTLALVVLSACSNSTDPGVGGSTMPLSRGPVRALELQATEWAGELLLSWISPLKQPGNPPLRHYEVAHSLQPISPADFGSIPKHEVDHLGVSDYHAILFEDLEPEVRHYFRVRAIDELGRQGTLSGELSETPLPPLTISGTIMALDANYRQPTPLAGVRVIGPGMESFSDANGKFELPMRRGYGSIALELEPAPTMPPLYSIMSIVPETAASQPQFLLLPQTTVTVLLPVETDWPFIRLLRHLSDKYIVDAEVAHWESYPVEVHVPEKILSNGVDYGAAIRLGIQKWNESVGFTVLVESSDEPEVGVVTSYDLRLYGGGLLGSVTILEPAGGKLYATVPLKLSLELGEWYASQALADRVALHELGHVLYLTHSPSHNHVLSVGVSGSSPNEVHPDEASVLRALIHTPNGTRYSWYHE